MSKVRVPPELRPPSRFEPFTDPHAANPLSPYHGPWRVKGVFRQPKWGEAYWLDGEWGVLISQNIERGPRVILERVSP